MSKSFGVVDLYNGWWGKGRKIGKKSKFKRGKALTNTGEMRFNLLGHEGRR